MSRTKKSRRLKDKLDIKTGSKKNFIERGQKGRIPSKNKLAKHPDKLKSAFKKHLEDHQNLPQAERKSASEEAEALAAAPAPFSRAAKQAEREKPTAEHAPVEPSVTVKPHAQPKNKAKQETSPSTKDGAVSQKAMDTASKKAKPTPIKPVKPNVEQTDTAQPAKEKPRFDQLSGDDLWDLLDD